LREEVDYGGQFALDLIDVGLLPDSDIQESAGIAGCGGAIGHLGSLRPISQARSQSYYGQA
jgi:hypothetical protein